MTVPFNLALGLIVVQAEVYGPTSSQVVNLALDTGSARTIIDPGTLTRVGYDLSQLPTSVKATTVSGQIRRPSLDVSALGALGRTVPNHRVVAHRLPNASVDGILGLDFLRAHVLTIDFVKGEITLTP